MKRAVTCPRLGYCKTMIQINGIYTLVVQSSTTVYLRGEHLKPPGFPGTC